MKVIKSVKRELPGMKCTFVTKLFLRERRQRLSPLESLIGVKIGEGSRGPVTEKLQGHLLRCGPRPLESICRMAYAGWRSLTHEEDSVPVMLTPTCQTLPSGLFCRYWCPDNEVRGAVIVVHGLGEHSGRYQALAEVLRGTRLGGHWRSITPAMASPPGHRVFIRHFDEFLTGVRECREHLLGVQPDAPCFILGHSMGGLIVSRLLLEDQHHYRGALLSGPAFEAGEPPSPILLKVVGLLAKLLPRFGCHGAGPPGESVVTPAL